MVAGSLSVSAEKERRGAARVSGRGSGRGLGEREDGWWRRTGRLELVAEIDGFVAVANVDLYFRFDARDQCWNDA